LKGDSPVQIDLSNDSATIGTDAEGNYDPETLEELTKTTATAKIGTANIPDC
jgi:hypothetical protein